MFRAIWQAILLWWRPAPKVVVAPPPLPAEEPVVKQTVTEIASNRHERRQLERARRKYDKFVKPKGALPQKPATPRQPKPKTKKVEVIVPAESVADDAELLIADTHHENRNDLVAYKEAETYGEFNFRDTILQQLERYFFYLERMKKHDAQAYGYYREVGATILPYVATFSSHRGEQFERDAEPSKTNTPLADYFHQRRPSFACFTYGADPETERYEREAKSKKGHALWVPKFMYFMKYKKPPPEMQLISGGDIYKMTVWWDRTSDGKKKYDYGTPQEFGIFVSHDGKEVIALRSCDTKYVEVHSHREKRWVNRTGHYIRGPALRRGDLGHITVPHRAYRIPSEFEKWARDNGDSAQHFLTELFKQSVMRNEHAQYSMTRVTATNNNGVSAVFSVNIHRTSYFFQDRDIAINDGGTRKRIFHFVRPHVRSDGTEVKAHFRGEREFTWAGYDIKITIPGRDHLDLADIDVGSVDEYWWEKDVKYLDMPALGKKLKGWMDEGKGKRV